MIKEKVKILTDVVALKTREILSQHNELVLTDKKGLVIQTNKDSFNFSVKDRKKFLNLPVELFLSQYEIPVYGEIDSIEDLENDLIEIKIRFLNQTPYYYRECLKELLN